MRYSTTRLWIWLPPAFFFGLTAIVALAAPDVGTRIFYAVLAVGTGYWLLRARRVGVEISTGALVVHGQFRKRRIDLGDVRGASAVPLRTASPLYRYFPYVALELDLANGTTRHFEELSVRERDRSVVDEIVAAVNAAVSQSGG